ncbi:MAG: ROK family protein [candidate division Zixibacteria bacterium]|nr:ROK family protein [candidate division Zixibacteria bacterium]
MRKRYFIGVDLGGTNIKFGIVSDKGEILYKGMLSARANLGRDAILNNINKAIEQSLTFAREKKIKIKGIGVGSPGTVNLESGKIEGSCPNIPQLVDVNLKRWLSDYFKFPIYVDNDANLMALAESKFGAAKGYKDALCLTLGTGIGGGIILDGKLFHGSNFAGAEFGHMSICSNGRKCNCGGIGCLEMYASAPAMVKDTKRLLKRYRKSIIHKLIKGDLDTLTTEVIFQAEKKGDVLASDVINQACTYLGAGIASAVNLLNPQVVVIGGGVSEGGPSFIRRIEKEVKIRAFPSATKSLKVVKAKLGNDAGFIGAAILCSSAGK